MSPKKQQYGAEETPPATTPRGGESGFSSTDHSFTLQAIMDLKGSMAELKITMQSVVQSVDGIKTKVDDLVNWKNRIIGGVIVLGAIFALGGFLVGKFWEYVTIKPPAAQVQIQPVPEPKAPEKPAAKQAAKQIRP